MRSPVPLLAGGPGHARGRRGSFFRLLVPAVLLACPAAAEVFTGREGFHFSLARGSVSSPEDSDLKVTSHGVFAKYGVKRASRRGAFSVREVAALDERYDLRDAAGGKWRMWIRVATGEVVEVELIRARKMVPRTTRVFRPVAVTIDGLPADPTFAELTLLVDGRYRFGTNRGRYVPDEGGVTFDGVPGQWGRAAWTVDGDGLIFRFLRGRALYELRYEQLVNVSRGEGPGPGPTRTSRHLWR